MRSFKCEICQDDYPESLHHLHHKIPKALGGTDDDTNMVNLCQTDHQLLHTIAFMIVNPKRRQEIEPALSAIYPNEKHKQKKVVEFANFVAREMALKRELKKEADAEVRATIELPQLYLELIRLAGYDMPHANGKPAGVGNVLRVIVAEFLSKKFPMKREQIQSLRKRNPNR